MLVRARKNFSGIISMSANEIRDIETKELINDLLNAGYIEKAENNKETKNNEEKKNDNKEIEDNKKIQEDNKEIEDNKKIQEDNKEKQTKNDKTTN